MKNQGEIGHCKMCNEYKVCYSAYESVMCARCRKIGYDNVSYYRRLGVELNLKSIYNYIQEKLATLSKKEVKPKVIREEAPDTTIPFPKY
jgi:hypothetical protein